MTPVETIPVQRCERCGSLLESTGDRMKCLACALAGALDPPRDALPAIDEVPVDPAGPRTVLRRFGDYELLAEVARGGMGVVYRARHISLGRIVALKMILFGSFARAETHDRFRAEARTGARLKHPHIVPIHDFGTLDGQPWFTMDLIDGPNLGDALKQGPFSCQRAATLLKDLAETVAYAHGEGVLHRDLKPSNILLDPTEAPHLTDFGLARELNLDSSLTLSGQELGSPNYMAPEQAVDARNVTARADLWSLGAILYHMLTGRPPFVGATVADTLRVLKDDEPVTPRSLSAGIPNDVETICLKCLEKDPARRYATAQELANDLGRFLRHEPVHARSVTRVERAWRWCRRKPVLASLGSATLILLLTITIGAPIALYRINREWQRAEKNELAARTSELRTRQNAYASDMNLAHQAVEADEFDRALQLLNQHRPGEEAREQGQGSSERARLSPGSEQLLPRPSSLAQDLRGWEWRYLWKQIQGEERFILGEHTNGATAVGMLADGKTVFSAGWDKFVRLWDLESRRPIGLLPQPEAVIGAAVSPDGRWLATSGRNPGGSQLVLLWDLATRNAATLTNGYRQLPESITFSPDSKWLAFATAFGGVRLWDVNARSEVTNLPAMGPDGPFGIAFSPDSLTLAYNENEFGAIQFWDIASRSVSRLTGHQGAVTALAFSTHGQTLVSGSNDRTAKLWNLASRLERSQFTNHSGAFGRVAFSPDGRTLALSVGGGAGRVIRLVDVETGNPKAELRGHLNVITSLAFTRDGRTLLSASDDGTIRVWDAMPRAKEKPFHGFVRNSISLAWRAYGPALRLSPDGRHLLTVYTNQTFSVWDTLRLAEGKRHPLPFTNTTMAAVAPGGRVAAFGSWRGEVMLWDVELGQARSFVPPPDTNRVHLLVFSLDGRYLAAADDAKTSSQMSAVKGTKRTVRMWDVVTRKGTQVFSAEDEFPVSLIFSANARSLVAGFMDGQVKLWPLDQPGGTATFLGHSWWVGGLAMSTNGQSLISAGPDIRFWDVRTRRENSLKLSPRPGGNGCIALSSDGRRLAAAASDGRITIWDTASHQEVVTLEGHQETVTQLAFTPDGDHLVSASKDQLRVWRAASWPEIEAAEREAK